MIDKEEKLIHTLRASKHNLDPLINKLGSEENVIREILKALSGKVHFNEKFEDLVVHIDGFEVYTRGRVMDGIPKLGTFFIKGS